MQNKTLLLLAGGSLLVASAVTLAAGVQPNPPSKGTNQQPVSQGSQLADANNLPPCPPKGQAQFDDGQEMGSTGSFDSRNANSRSAGQNDRGQFNRQPQQGSQGGNKFQGNQPFGGQQNANSRSAGQNDRGQFNRQPQQGSQGGQQGNQPVNGQPQGGQGGQQRDNQQGGTIFCNSLGKTTTPQECDAADKAKGFQPNQGGQGGQQGNQPFNGQPQGGQGGNQQFGGQQGKQPFGGQPNQGGQPQQGGKQPFDGQPNQGSQGGQQGGGQQFNGQPQGGQPQQGSFKAQAVRNGSSGNDQTQPCDPNKQWQGGQPQGGRQVQNLDQEQGQFQDPGQFQDQAPQMDEQQEKMQMQQRISNLTQQKKPFSREVSDFKKGIAKTTKILAGKKYAKCEFKVPAGAQDMATKADAIIKRLGDLKTLDLDELTELDSDFLATRDSLHGWMPVNQLPQLCNNFSRIDTTLSSHSKYSKKIAARRDVSKVSDLLTDYDSKNADLTKTVAQIKTDALAAIAALGQDEEQPAGGQQNDPIRSALESLGELQGDFSDLADSQNEIKTGLRAR